MKATARNAFSLVEVIISMTLLVALSLPIVQFIRAHNELAIAQNQTSQNAVSHSAWQAALAQGIDPNATVYALEPIAYPALAVDAPAAAQTRRAGSATVSGLRGLLDEQPEDRLSAFGLQIETRTATPGP